MNKSRLTIILLIFVQCFLLSGVSRLALATLPENALDIPSQYGTVEEVFEADYTADNRERMIIHIQDAHSNYEAQKNMAQLLEYLVKEHNLRLIMVEGGSGNVSLSFLRGYANQKERRDIADKYLRMGEISGEEYLDMVSNYDLDLYGIEDQDLYDAHLAAFLEVDSIKEEGLSYLKDLSNIVSRLKRLIYTEELKELEEQGKNYKHKVISLSEYCQYLEGMARKKGLNLESYPHLTAFSEIARLEQEIDFPRAELERNTFIKDLAQLLSREEVTQLLEKSKQFKTGEISSPQYYSFLKDIAAERLDLAQRYPYFNSYTRYITVNKEIEVKYLLREVNAIEESIKEVYSLNTVQRRLNEISKSIQIVTKFLNLELTPQDYAYFKANRDKFITASWRDFLNEQCRSYNLGIRPSVSDAIDKNLEELDEFYQLGIAREGAFMRNMVEKIDKSGEKLTVLIAGGFHTPGITRMLKDNGYSYMVVTPVITKRSDPSVYLSVLRGEKQHQEKSFNDR